ncbi:MAG: TonB-dependent receptor [Gemmatimonadota bacterium]
MISIASYARAVRSAFGCSFALLALASTQLSAQQGNGSGNGSGTGTGTVAGRVAGPDGNALDGATVSVVGSTITSITDRSGIFRLSGVPAGVQRVLVRALGKKPSEQAVTVAPSGTVSVAVAMELASTTLAGITVTGERGGQLRSADQKRRSVTVSDVVSADEIGLLPDQNVAEAVQRVPGVYMETTRGEGRTVSIRGVAPNLNNVTLNGQPMASTSGDRASALDLLPASMVANIEVTKAVTPDMDANTIGGTVNLRTLTAFDRPRPFFFGIFEGLQNDRQVPFGKTQQPYEADVTVGRRFGRDGTLGLVLSGSASRRDNAVSVLDPDGWVKVLNRTTGDSITVSNEIEQQLADNDRTRMGLTSSLDWRPRPETNLFLRGLYTRTTEVERNSEFEITFTGAYEFPAGSKVGRNTASSMELDISRDEEKENLYSLSTGGSQRWGKWTMDAVGVATRGESRSFGPDATFENPSATNVQAPVGLNFSKYFYGVTPENPLFVTNPSSYNLNGLSFNRSSSVENTIIAAADWRYDSRLGRFPAFLKFGTKLQNRDKDIDESSDRYTNSALTLLPFSQQVSGRLQDGASTFVQGNVDPFAAFVSRTRGTDSLRADLINSQIQTIDNDAYVKERITAGYLMGTIEAGRLTALTGVRVEHTKSEAEFWELDENTRNPLATRFVFPTALTQRSNSYTNVLPSAIFKFDAGPQMVLRAAYTSTIARPQFTQLASYTRANYIPDLANPNIFDGTVTDNNPDLQPYTSANYDVSAEYYPKTGGQFSVGYFRKQIDNPIYTFRSTQRDIAYDGRQFSILRYTQLRNGAAGNLGGVEFSWNQPLFFMPGVLKGLGVTSNVAFIKSELSIEGRAEKLPFLGQPDQVLNVIPYFQLGTFELRFAYARRSGYLASVQTPGFDRFRSARETMDLTARYQVLGPKLEVIATARNLANAPEVGYQGNTSQYDVHTLTGRTFSLGLRTTR